MSVICRADEIEAGTGKEVCIDGPDGKKAWIVLFLCKGDIVAYHNACPHQGRALNWAPDRFMIADPDQLVCPHHGATFNLRDGLCVSGPCAGASLEPVSIQLNDGDVILTERIRASLLI